MMKIETIIKKYGNNGVFTIAEIGNNHMGDLKIAKKMIVAASQSGASAVKFQKRANQNLFQDNYAKTPYIGKNSFGDTYIEHRNKLELSIKDMANLKKFSETKNILFFVTPFDESSLNELENIGCELYKVASADIVNHPLLEAIALTGKPAILSTGGATLEEIAKAVDIFKSNNSSIALLQCTAAYPVDPEDMELKVIETFKNSFPGIPLGLSDHQSGISMSIVAYMLGARIFEKHFTLHRSWKGADQSFSLEPEGFRKLVRDLLHIDAALGSGDKKPLKIESDAIFKMRKSVILKSNLKSGQKLKREHVEFKCPWNGLAVNELDKILGSEVKKDLPKGHVLKLDDFK